MNARTLSRHYAQLTGEERLRLMLAAQARGDQAELVSLWASCPTMEVIAPDPNFSRLIHQVLEEFHSVIRQWVELSHYVVRDRLLASVLLESEDDIALARKIEAQWRRWSAAWKGMESGITDFCAQTELTREQVMLEPSPVIEEARDHLHPQSRVSRALATGVLRRLRRAWAGADPSLEDDEDDDLH